MELLKDKSVILAEGLLMFELDNQSDSTISFGALEAKCGLPGTVYDSLSEPLAYFPCSGLGSRIRIFKSHGVAP